MPSFQGLEKSAGVSPGKDNLDLMDKMDGVSILSMRSIQPGRLR